MLGSYSRRMAYFINLALIGWATIHDEACAFTRTARQRPVPDNWRGPFATIMQAEAVGRAAGFRPGLCRICERRERGRRQSESATDERAPSGVGNR